MALHFSNSTKWPDPFKDEVSYVDNPIESGFPGHWLPISIIKKIMEMRVLTLASDLNTLPRSTPKVVVKLKLHVSTKSTKTDRKITIKQINEINTPRITVFKDVSTLLPITFSSTLKKYKNINETSATLTSVTDKITSKLPELSNGTAFKEVTTLRSTTKGFTTSTTVSSTYATTSSTTVNNIKVLTTLSSTFESPTTVKTTQVLTTPLSIFESPTTVKTTQVLTTPLSPTTVQTTKVLTTPSLTTASTTTPKTTTTTQKTSTSTTPTTTTETGNPFY